MYNYFYGFVILNQMNETIIYVYSEEYMHMSDSKASLRKLLKSMIWLLKLLG